MVSLITDSEVLEVVLDPVRNCGTTGTARVLTGNANKTNQKSLVNFSIYGYANCSASYAASTTSSSSTGMDS